MATWGAHFRIAENILKEFPNINRPFFAIGNIAPDCGVPNENWSSFTPSKEISHFTVSKMSNFLEIESDKFFLNDIKFFSKYLKDVNLDSLKDDKSFLLGYFIHLITDNLWNYYIMKPLKDTHLKEFQRDENFIWKVKRDWYDLDKIYITENKDSIFWTDFLMAEYNEDFLDFLPREGVLRQLDLIKNFYQITKEEYLKISRKEFVYLEKKDMDNFIQNSTNVILEVLKQIIDKKFEFNDKISVLDDIICWN
ncbi:MAG: zinc dependent phospholipase C family protein [Candidatus Lokiarchaeota archaeon]|nr:zinc dependent phospholipase C family protein [Candidatus Lokiarchaeota archaeon]